MKNLRIAGLAVVSLAMVLYGCGNGTGSGVSLKAGKGSISMASVKATLLTDEEGGSGSGTPGMTTATALVIQPTDTYSGTLPDDPDFHAFSITFPSPGAFTAYTTSNLDTLGSLWDQNIDQLTWDDDSGTNANFMFCFEVSPGQHYLVAESFPGTPGGPYTLNVNFVSGGSCSGGGGGEGGGGAPGNTTGTALNIQPTDTYSGTLPDDPDFHAFSINIPSTGAFTASTTGSTDTMGGLYDQNVNNLIFDDNSGTGDNFSFCIEINAGLYYLGVFPLSSGGPYTLNVNFVSGGSCSGGEGGEGGGGTPGNTTGTALNIQPTDTYSGTLPDGPDFHAFSINIPSTGAFSASVTGKSIIDGGLYDSNVNNLILVHHRNAYLI